MEEKSVLNPSLWKPAVSPDHVFTSVFRATTLSRPGAPEVLPGNASVKLQLLRPPRSAARAPPVLLEISLVSVTQRYVKMDFIHSAMMLAL